MKWTLKQVYHLATTVVRSICEIDTNEPGRVIGYHGKVLKALQLLAQNYSIFVMKRASYISINVNDYVEHRAEVLQSYAQKNWLTKLWKSAVASRQINV